MERILRGHMEKEIDNLLEPKVIYSVVLILKEFLAEPKENNVFTFVIGAVFGRFLSLVDERYDRLPTENEIKEFLEMVERRTMEIKSKIKFAMSK